MSHVTRATALPSLEVEPTEASAQRSIVLALMAMVVLLDQATKWWGWRHVPGPIINAGGDLLVGSTVGSWYAQPTTGALLDLLGFGLLSTAVFVLVRRRRPAVVLASAALMIGGWGSNLLDRLGMHSWTAPGSVRGAVDFIPFGHDYYNVADAFILGGTLLFGLSVGYLRLGEMLRSAAAGATRPALHARPRRRAWVPAFAAAVGLAVLVVVGRADHGGTAAEPTSASASATSGGVAGSP
jgi:lipoprotein signal peptidase